MAKDLMWAYLIHLSCHMWDDKLSEPRGLFLDPMWEDENKTDVEIWDKVIKSLAEYKINTLLIDVGDGIQYESHPEISAPDAWSKDFLKQKLSEIRALGITPIPKLNFSTCHDAWMKEYGRYVSTSVYYQVCADLIREVCEVFDYPKYFHLGMDEENDRFQKLCDIAVIRHETMWLHDVNFLCRECEKHGARPWIWACLAPTYPKIFEEKLSRSVLVSNGFYGRFRLEPWENGKNPYTDYLSPRTYDMLDKLGFDQVITGSTWSYEHNIYQSLAYGKDRLNPDRLLGYLSAPWYHTKPGNLHPLIGGAERLYYARKKWYPETL